MSTSLAFLVLAANVATAAVFAGRPPPISEAITMITNLRDKLTTEGEREAATYNTFACFCKDTMGSTSKAITAAQDSKDTLEGDLNDAVLARDAADTAIGAADQAIAGLKQDIEQLTSQRHKELMQYEKDELDLTSAVQALDAAIQMLKASKPGTSFLEVVQNHTQKPTLWKSVQSAISTALLIEGFSPLSLQAPIASSLQLILQQQEKSAEKGQRSRSDPNEEYTFHSDDIISTLEDLRSRFKGKKIEISQSETTLRQTYEQQVQAKESEITTKETELATQQGNKAAEAQRVFDTSKDLSATAAQLLDDQKFLAEFSEKCNSKAVLWDERTNSRVAELSALTHALEVLGTLPNVTASATMLVEEHSVKAISLHSGAERSLPVIASMLQIRELAHSAPQVRSQPPGHVAARDGPATWSQMLRKRAVQLQSVTLLKLAETAADDPFAKVKTIIQNLIERLLKQASDEANHTAWCTKEFELAEQSRDRHAQELTTLNGKLELGEARQVQIEMFLQNLEAELLEINSTLDNSTQLRENEKEEHETAIREANESQVVVAQVLDTLTKFYAAAQNNVSQAPALAPAASFVQIAAEPRNETPDAGFVGAYGGAQDGPLSVLAILEVIQSDFESTIAETQKLEETAVREYNELQTRMLSSRAEKEVIQTDRKSALVAANATNIEDKAKLTENSDELVRVLGEMITLKTACSFQPMTVAEMKMKREEELEALKQALCILGNHGLGSSSISC